MLKRKEFILGAAAGLTIAAAATAGGVIQWPGAQAEPARAASGRLVPSAGAAGLAFAPPQGAPLSFAQIFEQVAPAVVQIDVRTRVQRPRTFSLPGFPFALPVPPGADGGGEESEGPTALGAGSGFFISGDGFIVTNNHVVADAQEIRVKLSDGRDLTARLVGRDESTDLAVIKVEGSDFPFVSFEESAEPRVGDWVIAVGNPFGLGGTATAGIVSAKARNIDPIGYNDYLQIDAAINRGNSGGPTFDIYGRVIGVNTAIFSPTGGSVGIGFAIPASTAKSITDRLMRGESIQRGYLGVGITSLSSEQREALGLPSDFGGAFVGDVTAGGPADQAGLQVGDIVSTMNGRKVESSNDLTRRVGQVRPGETIRLEILRDGRRQTINVRSGTRPSESELNRSGPGDDRPGAGREEAVGQEVAGLTVSPLTDTLRRRYSVPANIQGLVVTQAASVGDLNFQPGFVITRANNGAVRTAKDLSDAVEEARRAGRSGVFLLVWTPNQGNVPVVLRVPARD